MASKQYKLQYLPLFWDDVSSAVLYISNVLQNETAALRLIDKLENEILKHLENPTAAVKYKTAKERSLPYYWFPVGNYMVFYVIDGDIMEVRRFVYGARDLTKVVV